MKKMTKIIFFLSWLVFALISFTTPFYIKHIKEREVPYNSMLATTAIDLAVRCGDREKALFFYDELRYIYGGKFRSGNEMDDLILEFFIGGWLEILGGDFDLEQWRIKRLDFYRRLTDNSNPMWEEYRMRYGCK